MLRRDEEAASPLAVIVAVVLVATFATIAVYALFFDRPEPGVELVARREGTGPLEFEVHRAAGGLQWSALELRLVDRGGHDLRPTLHVPEGDVRRGDVVRVDPLPAAGTYVLLAVHDGRELDRVVVAL